MNTEILIAEILARPAIWQSSHPQHKFKHVVKRLWEEIKIKFSEYKVSDLKKKWKNLRDTYSKELKKIPKSRSGDSFSNYEPAWKYFTLLGFLKDEYMHLTAESNLDVGDSEIIDSGDDDDISVEVLLNEVRSPPSPTRTSSPMEPSTSSSKRKRQNIQDIRAEYLEIEKKKPKILENDISRNIPVDSENKTGDYYFLMSILPEMEKLPTIQKIRLRNKINQALLDELTYGLHGYPSQPNQLNNSNNE
ncbi:unnamed protein product [Parnassius apollo]|uniref:(apollo) hypothetical protein n=1 Tax=Parnassius apollo TaxID=110799 RepID=A0A8S3W885_PARAO|nr:unnamed protein product [Parnassius apollo]